MSSLSEQNPLNPQDPLHYAPRHMRERPESARLSLVEDTRRDQPAQAERSDRAVAARGNLDSRLENAVFESLHSSLNPHVMREPLAFTREQDRRSVVFKIAGRFAAAIGVAAVVALFFVNIVPVSRQPDASSSFVAAVQSMKTTTPPPAPLAAATAAVPEEKDIKAEQAEIRSTADADKADVKTTSALSQFQSLLTDDATQAPKAEKPESSDKRLLEQFMQWNQKTNPSDRTQ